ncbi:MAG TPA: DUF5919 domain-containing protein [Pseudonocardiaceae bacterium]|nr:DUF5919 domain-containing protein [Pseudonocardiaceae bacterium]
MNSKPIALKVLLQQRHLQGHRSFCREYDKVASQLDKSLTGSWPSKAQFYRWISGELVGLPYADHCRILESMFPGWTAGRLFDVYDASMEFVPNPSMTTTDRTASRPLPVTAPVGHGVADLVAAFPSRSEFSHEMPPGQLFTDAKRIRLAGLSLNLLCQQYPDRQLVQLLETGTTVECLFLDPAGVHIREREREEDHPDGVLSTLTTVNIESMRRVRSKLSAEAQGNLVIRTYDEVVRFNITIIDDDTCVVQPYMPGARGMESPTLVMERQETGVGLFDTFEQVFTTLWERSKEVE